ncbi:DUF6705 family protein [Mucilaginibacter terrae]|uniref:DUF6705 family protein n=1 Tax=Mucilaginibacter terrae TaxID=1955052 RepID=UPI0036424648
MKKLAIVLFAFCLSGTLASAQDRDTIDAESLNVDKLPRAGTVISNRHFSKFVGTWVFQDAQSQLTIKLEKKKSILVSIPFYLRC